MHENVHTKHSVFTERYRKRERERDRQSTHDSGFERPGSETGSRDDYRTVILHVVEVHFDRTSTATAEMMTSKA